MKGRVVVASLLACPLLLGCGNSPVPSSTSADIVNHTGTVRQIGSVGYAIVDDAESSERFAPSNLPDSFKRDGVRVLFSGRRGEIPPNVRMWGTPLELTSIQADIR